MIPAGRNVTYPEYGGHALDNSPAGGPSGFTPHTLILLEDFKAVLSSMIRKMPFHGLALPRQLSLLSNTANDGFS
jgi:hypothetical protein